MSSIEDRTYLNNMKGILIILVVVGHFLQTLLNCVKEWMPTFAPVIQGAILFIYAFHMPVFIFISGYLSKNTEKRRQNAFFDLFFLYLVYEILVGIICSIASPQRGWEVFQNIFIPRYASWYLLALFIWRLLLPDLVRIKGVLWIALMLNIGTCIFTGFGYSFDLRRILGFLFYFLLGYYTSEERLNRIRQLLSRKLALLGLGIELIAFILLTNYYPIYPRVLSVFARKVDINGFSHWYYAIGYYAIAFGVTMITGFIFLCAITNKNSYVEKIGEDTMPLYLSHAIVYHMAGYVVDRNILPGVAEIVLVCMTALICVFLFSSTYYRKLFWNSIHGLVRVVRKQE